MALYFYQICWVTACASRARHITALRPYTDNVQRMLCPPWFVYFRFVSMRTNWCTPCRSHTVFCMVGSTLTFDTTLSSACTTYKYSQIQGNCAEVPGDTLLQQTQNYYNYLRLQSRKEILFAMMCRWGVSRRHRENYLVDVHVQFQQRQVGLGVG